MQELVSGRKLNVKTQPGWMSASLPSPLPRYRLSFTSYLDESRYFKAGEIVFQSPGLKALLKQ